MGWAPQHRARWDEGSRGCPVDARNAAPGQGHALRRSWDHPLAWWEWEETGIKPSHVHRYKPRRDRYGGEAATAPPALHLHRVFSPTGWRNNLLGCCPRAGKGSPTSPGTGPRWHPPSRPARSPGQLSPRTASRRPGSSPPAAPPALCFSAAAGEAGRGGWVNRGPPASPGPTGPAHLVLELVELLLQRRLLALEQRRLLGLVEGEDVLFPELADQRVLRPRGRGVSGDPRPSEPPPPPPKCRSPLSPSP